MGVETMPGQEAAPIEQMKAYLQDKFPEVEPEALTEEKMAELYKELKDGELPRRGTFDSLPEEDPNFDLSPRLLPHFEDLLDKYYGEQKEAA